MGKNEIIYACLNCREEFSSFEVDNLIRKLNQTEVICPICNGYIINPKGEYCVKGVCL